MNTYTIAEVSAKFGLPISTLRYYEEIGLLPNVARDGKNRLYNQDNLDRLAAICCFKDTGMTLKELQTLFQYEDQDHDLNEVVDLLQTHCRRVEDQLVLLKENQRHIRRKLQYYTDIRDAQLNHQPHPDWNDYPLSKF
ncbi:MerR family transcriptional regulator [Lentilactobacillus kisonensis]|uniref:Transcriptional regulator, MerR family n=2 Tax=Lentilactobacillus kisonensis TaxID=481722 RepID=H1LF61_9LACO|nr:MerR family transcriptional regulator [Lentilactobacillus kisonensis]EHO52065.1 transcriptional regulator, MerR family [Lentilactobacillus kisonensis F0435]KRL23147.1 transcriptional regulator, MerR family [Lentilactobacillus kisonensis DSM 19906 = JCM 15041]